MAETILIENDNAVVSGTGGDDDIHDHGYRHVTVLAGAGEIIFTTVQESAVL